MATSQQIVTISASADSTGAMRIAGVFWCAAPANNVVPLPSFKSVVPNILASDLAALRSGATVEVLFTAPSGFGASGAQSYASGTTQATIDADIQTMFTTVQTAVTSGNPGLATAINRAFNGSSWAAYTGAIGALPLGTTPQLVTDFYAAIAQGLLPNVAAGRAFGYVSTSGTTGVRVLATAYSPAAPGAAAQRSVVSSSANDTAAGTGARTVTITYLTTTFAVKTETVTLNGTTVVPTVGTDIAYIESIVVATCGSGLTNAGTITLNNTSAGGGALGSIAAGDGQTNWCHHYVPAGKTCLITNLSGGATVVAGRSILNRTGDPSQSTLPILPIGGQFCHLAGGNEDHPFQVPLVVPGPDRIFMTEIPNAVTASVAFAEFEYIQL